MYVLIDTFRLNRNEKKRWYVERIFILFLISQIVFLFNPIVIFAEDIIRSSSLHMEISEDGNTERIDYVNDDGEITYAADKHYATLIRTKSKKGILEKYYDALQQPVEQPLGYFSIFSEFNDQGQIYKITYLGIDEKPIIIESGYAIIIRTFNKEGFVETETYYDTDSNPVESSEGIHGLFKEYNEKGENTRIVILNQSLEPTICGQGYAILRRTYYDEYGLNEKVKDEYYFDQDDIPIRLSLGQYGIHIDYDELGRISTITYLDADGKTIPTIDGYSVVKKTYYDDDLLQTETYYDMEGNPVRLPEGQYGIRVEKDSGVVYLDSNGNDLFNIRNYLYGNQLSVVLICFIIVLYSGSSTRAINIGLSVFYMFIIFYMTLLYRKSGITNANLTPLWSYRQFFVNSKLRWEILNNIFLFIPFGTILYKIYPYMRVLFAAIIISVLIEFMQFVTGTGFAEIDDLISNCIGAFIGYFVGRVLWRSSYEYD